MDKLRLFTLSFLFIFAISVITPAYVSAEENQMKIIFMDTFYGMAAGALIATALSLTQDNPDWGANVGTGAAIGGIGGALFGVATEMRYLASMEGGHVTVSVPSIGLNRGRGDGGGVIYMAGAFQYKF